MAKYHGDKGLFEWTGVLLGTYFLVFEVVDSRYIYDRFQNVFSYPPLYCSKILILNLAPKILSFEFNDIIFCRIENKNMVITIPDSLIPYIMWSTDFPCRTPEMI